MRVNISLNEKVLADIDKSAKKLGLTRSGYISVCCEICMVMPFGMSDMQTKFAEMVRLFKGDNYNSDDPDRDYEAEKDEKK